MHTIVVQALLALRDGVRGRCEAGHPPAVLDHPVVHQREPERRHEHGRDEAGVPRRQVRALRERSQDLVPPRREGVVVGVAAQPEEDGVRDGVVGCLLYTSPSPRDS